MDEWSDYQEKTADFFRGIGLDASTNVAVTGVRTAHDVDVVVRANHVGFNLLWLVECKHWKTPVSKLHVLALRQIVADVGADRGILLAENGFQRGALEAAQLTNVQLTSLSELAITAGQALGMAKLRTIQDRVDQCSNRYWSIDKYARIEYGLRPDVASFRYSGNQVIQVVNDALDIAFRRGFPLTFSKVGWKLKVSMTRL